jgi:Protein of unknown function (DUF3822)
MHTPEQLSAASIPRQILDEAGEMRLSLHVGKGQIGAAVADMSEGNVKWHHFERFSGDSDWSDMIQVMRFRNWKESVFRKISISFDCEACTLVPSGFYEPSRADELLSVLYRNQASGETRTTDISLFSAKLLFRIPEELLELASWFQHARIYPSMHPLLLRNFDGSSKQAVLQYSSDYMLLRITEGKKLIFCNFFSVHHDEDILYFLANACMNLNIDMRNLQLFTEGIPAESSLMTQLSKYCQPLPSIPLMKLPDSVSESSMENLTLQNFLCE